jgi:hypothetical protein
MRPASRNFLLFIDTYAIVSGAVLSAKALASGTKPLIMAYLGLIWGFCLSGFF